MAMTDKELISVIVPVYNTREYLSRCVRSLCEQTYRELEILLIDDGSTDGSGALCDALAGEDARIRVFHKENGGSSSARNLGLQNARGVFVGFVDSDDWIEYNMYELLARAMLEYNVSVTQIGRDELDEAGNRLPDICVPPKEPECIPKEDFLRELLLHRGDCSFCTKLFRREHFENWQFPAGALNEDFRLLVSMLPEIGVIVSLPCRGYHVFYRMGSNTRKQDSFSRVFADNVDNADWVQTEVDTHYGYAGLSETAFRFGVFQRLDYLLHIPIGQMTRDNAQYREIVGYMRRNWLKAMKNPILTGKNKIYHTLLAAAPRTVRTLHRGLLAAKKRRRRNFGEKVK